MLVCGTFKFIYVADANFERRNLKQDKKGLCLVIKRYNCDKTLQSDK